MEERRAEKEEVDSIDMHLHIKYSLFTYLLQANIHEIIQFFFSIDTTILQFKEIIIIAGSRRRRVFQQPNLLQMRWSVDSQSYGVSNGLVKT